MQILPEETRREMAAFYYNQAASWKRPVVLTYKQPDLQEGTATIDLERSRMPDIYPDPWLTDSSISASSWSYATGQDNQIKRVELLGHKGKLKFTQTADGLCVTLPAPKRSDLAIALRITGLSR